MTASQIGIGMLGHGFMGKAHVHAYRTLPYIMWPPPVLPRLVVVGGRSESGVDKAARRYGFERGTTDWHEIVADPEVELFDNLAPNRMHAEPTIAAAEAGKHVICEKPLGRDANESYEIWTRVAGTGVKHLCAFNYRFVPAVRLTRELIDSGDLGEIRHFRARYLQDWLADPAIPMSWRLDREAAGSGAIGDLGAHLIDLAHYLVGDIASVASATRTFITGRPGGTVNVDDAFEATVEFDSGAVGTLEASRFAQGRKNALMFEINGSRGSASFDLERLNELQVSVPAAHTGLNGFGRLLVTEPEHPFIAHWWPPGHVLGWEHTFVHEIHHLLDAIAHETPVEPHGASFRDGYRAGEVCDAIERAARTGESTAVRYRELDRAGSVRGNPDCTRSS